MMGAHILERSFRYTPSTRTDIRKTFRRARRELANQAAEEREELTLALRAAGVDAEQADVISTVSAATQHPATTEVASPPFPRCAESAAFSSKRERSA